MLAARFICWERVCSKKSHRVNLCCCLRAVLQAASDQAAGALQAGADKAGAAALTGADKASEALEGGGAGGFSWAKK